MDKHRVHFLGIAGSGASSTAYIALANGFEVTGCDEHLYNQFTKGFGKEVLIEDPEIDHLEGIDILAVSPTLFSLDPNNTELKQAKERGIKVLTWQNFLGEYLTKDKFIISICGIHGKSTTTAMIGLLLEDAGLDPTVEIGAMVPNWDANYRIGQGEYIVIEADEFSKDSLHYNPDITVVTNLEMDHPEYFKNFESVKESYKKFLCQTKSNVVANLSDQGIIDTIGSGLECKLHGFHLIDDADFIIDYSKTLIDFPLKIPGEFNVGNASAVFHVGLLLKINSNIIKHSLMNYRGVGRRFEYIGKYQGAEIYSDFAHHPTEIKVTMQAAREKFPNARIILVYQPHSFSRTRTLFDDYVKIFQEIPIDKIYIADIYPAKEKDTGMVSSRELVSVIKKEHVEYAGNMNQVLDKIKPEIKKGDAIFFVEPSETDNLAKELVS